MSLSTHMVRIALLLAISLNGFSQHQKTMEVASTRATHWKSLSDTVVNGIALNFKIITKRNYDSLSRHVVVTKIPLQGYSHLVKNQGGYKLIKLKNNTTDTLCDKRESNGYFESYTIKGLWKEKNLMLARFQNWEEGGDLLINLNKPSHYFLSPDYVVSYNKGLILGYANAFKNPLYASGFSLTEISRNEARTLSAVELGALTILDARWLKNETCLIAAGLVDSQTRKLSSNHYYIMSVKKTKDNQ